MRQLGAALGVPILLENSTIFSAIPEPDMSEPAFFNRLHAKTGCGMLLDLHNLYANTLNLGISADEYLAELDPEIVVEIHLAGGDWLKGHYTDSHSRRTPVTGLGVGSRVGAPLPEPGGDHVRVPRVVPQAPRPGGHRRGDWNSCTSSRGVARSRLAQVA